jgi:hypothetical protein
VKGVVGLWRIWASIFSVAGAVGCFYQAAVLGVTAEEGLRYNPDISAHPVWRHMDLIADRWALGAKFFLLIAALFVSWHLYRHVVRRRALTRLGDPKLS